MCGRKSFTSNWDDCSFERVAKKSQLNNLGDVLVLALSKILPQDLTFAKIATLVQHLNGETCR